MKRFESLDGLGIDACGLTIGSFDGLHIGHQQIFRYLVEDSRKHGRSAVVLTFFPHPAEVLRGLTGPIYLTLGEEKNHILESFGIDAVITLPFSRQLAEISAEEFMRMLLEKTKLQKLVVGYDFALGKNRQGNPTRLAELGKSMGYEVEIISPVSYEGNPISSTLIRTQIRAGLVDEAKMYLGRWYSIESVVSNGEKRGSKLGYPTVNLPTDARQLLPSNGVYATWLHHNGRKLPSVTNIGFRPTFLPEQLKPLVETHIFNFNENLYGEKVRLEFVHFLRPEETYSSAAELIAQMDKDSIQAQRILENEE